MFFIVLAAASLISCSTARSSQYIVNGDDANIANHPYQGAFFSGNSFICGCAFVGSNWVLTAGHCVGNQPSSYQVGFGDSRYASTTKFGVSAITRHPDYNQGQGFTPNDIAVVQASQTISCANCEAITVARSAISTGATGDITGWGKVCGDAVGCGISDVLQVAGLPVISAAECDSIMGAVSHNPDVMICLFDGQQGACNGDSGGPYNSGNTLHGLTSWGKSDCDPATGASVYTRVSAFHDWVCTETNNGAQGC
jgi:secreted trypsin-like serine protease